MTLATVLLPVVLMLAKALADIFLPKGGPKSVLDIIGTPLIALLVAVVVAMFTFGAGDLTPAGRARKRWPEPPFSRTMVMFRGR